ncbi:hypothetical protein ACXYTJ_15950 [Gilvimarinus sp. F26214L]|uniref:hypothetical protein n=1 Tax=Gilvimarinus sp. DZF01 TaxID=3461371 RepID=UPI0040455CFC
MNNDTTILVGTRKGAWAVSGNPQQANWNIHGPNHLGSSVFHYVADPRNTRRRLMTIGGGHLGPSLFRSEDGGESWTEAERPPRFAKAGDEGEGRSVDHVFWLTPGHPSQPERWYAGTSPQGLFVSDDHGAHWEEVQGFNAHPDFFHWRGGDKDGTPDGPKLHSIIVDHSDPRHLLLGMSSGGIFESLDEGHSWHPLNRGVATDFFPPKEDGSEYEYGHDPHCMVMHPRDSNRLYHQNHCGIYRMDRDRSDRWERIGDNMPQEVGDIGFPIVVHPRDVDTAWVFPMDGSGLWPRTSPGGKPAVYRTRDGGASWTRHDDGFPRQQAWWTVKRQCMAVGPCGADSEPVGLFLGTTNGQLWGSFDEGESWRPLAMDLPHIYSVEVVGA